jgi:hypothetical protein
MFLLDVHLIRILGVLPNVGDVNTPEEVFGSRGISREEAEQLA